MKLIVVRSLSEHVMAKFAFVLMEDKNLFQDVKKSNLTIRVGFFVVFGRFRQMITIMAFSHVFR